MQIRNIKNITDLEFDIPTERGLYAITGENGSGKSTIISGIATSFYNLQYNDYFGEPRENSEITYYLEGKKRRVVSRLGEWLSPRKKLGVYGFYEGSIVYGYRFKNIEYELVEKLSKVSKEDLVNATNFVKENLGRILHDNPQYYKELYILKKKRADELGLKRTLFYYKSRETYISQLQMSTGENLLLTILKSLEISSTPKGETCYPRYVLLDEVELALHSSAIRRFVFVLEQLARELNFVVIFSTHSIEILRGLKPENIYYVQNYPDGNIDLINPCYPVFATRNLESANYGHDFIIMVEDILAKQIVERVLSKERLLGNKRVLVIPIGGWHQVIRFAYDTIKSNLALSTTRILIVLDRDIENEVKKFMKSERIGFSTSPNFLPIQSLEKFLMTKLTGNVDKDLFNELNNYIFQGKSLNILVQEYRTKLDTGEYIDKNGNLNENVKNGKAFYLLLKDELRQIRKDEKELVDFVTDYLFMQKNNSLDELVTFFRTELEGK